MPALDELQSVQGYDEPLLRRLAADELCTPIPNAMNYNGFVYIGYQML